MHMRKQTEFFRSERSAFGSGSEIERRRGIVRMRGRSSASFGTAARMKVCGLLAASAHWLARTAFQLAHERWISVVQAKAILRTAARVNRQSIRLRRGSVREETAGERTWRVKSEGINHARTS